MVAGTCPVCEAPLVKRLSITTRLIQENKPSIELQTYRCSCWLVSTMQRIGGVWKWVRGPAARGSGGSHDETRT